MEVRRGGAVMQTAKQLDIPQTVYDAVVLTLDLFEHGNAIHVRPLRASPNGISWQPLSRSERPPPSLFSMLVWEEPTECGSIRCVGGWTEWFAMRGGGTLKFDKIMPQGIADLFYPSGVDWKLITVAQAAAAIRSYLQTGDPNPVWEQAHAEHQQQTQGVRGTV